MYYSADSNNTLSKEELISLFSNVGAISTLGQIGVYIYYRCVYLWIHNHNPSNDYFENELQEYSADLISKMHLQQLSRCSIRVMWSTIHNNTLYNEIAKIEPDSFINAYYYDYFSLSNTFSTLHNALMPQVMIMPFDYDHILFYHLLYIHENYPQDGMFFHYHRFTCTFDDPLISNYKSFCKVWSELFVIPKIRKLFPKDDLTLLFESLQKMKMTTTYEKSLIVLYAVLYRDYRLCEHKNDRIEKLRDGNDQIKIFESNQAVFTVKNPDRNKVRFLNRLFEATVPSGFMYSSPNNIAQWKIDFSNLLKFFGACSLEFSLNLLIPEAFPSISTVIAFLSQYPSREKHSTDRKIIEIICAYLYSLEQNSTDKVAAFKSYLENTLQRDGLYNFDDIYEHMNTLRTSYAVAPYKGKDEYRRIIADARSLLAPSEKKHDGAMLKHYLTTSNKEINAAKKLNEVPALYFFMNNQNNSCLVEDSLIFEDVANRVMQLYLHSVVLLQPSYSFLIKWLSDYRTKTRKTTVVIYDESIVQCLNEKFSQNKLISENSSKKYLYNLHIISSINNIYSYDLAISFYNKKEPRYDDLIALSRLLTSANRMICVLPRFFFEEDTFEKTRAQMLSYASIKMLTHVNSNLFSCSPKKKYIIDFGKNNPTQTKHDIPIRFIEIDKGLQGAKGNLIQSDLGIYYIGCPTEDILKMDRPYEGKSIRFIDVYRTQNDSTAKEKQHREKAREIRMASDFIILYTVTDHFGKRQAKCYFTKYRIPSKAVKAKKNYGKRIEESKVIVSAENDDALEKKIKNEFPLSERFKNLRNVAAEEIKSAFDEGILKNISLFSFTLAYSDEVRKHYVSRYDYEFCYRVLCGTSLGSLILNESTQDDFDKAIAELTDSNNIDQFKLLEQLGFLLDIASKRGVLFDSQSPVFTYLESRKKALQTKAQMRDAFTTKTLSFDEERHLIEWLLKRIPQKPVYLGTMIKLLTGMSSPEVCMLTWDDYCKTEHSKYYHFKVTKQMDKKTSEIVLLSSAYKYRIVPIPSFLSDLINEHKDRYKTSFGIASDKKLANYPLITTDYKGKEIASGNKAAKYPKKCSVNWLLRKSQEAKEKGAELPEKIVSYWDADITEDHDLNSYNADFYASNFKFHALNDAMMTQGEIAYILGLAPRDTFSRHYCDYSNPFIQIKLVEKLNDWCANYATWNNKPEVLSGIAQSEFRRRSILPVNAECTAGQILLTVNKKCLSDIEIMIASDRGIRGTITTYERQKNE